MQSPEGQELVWDSVRWPNDAWFEGLTLRGRPHGSGVLLHANGDRYEGEFSDGHMDGYGVYVWASGGALHRGHWMRGRAHGCGVRMWRGAGAQLNSSSSDNSSSTMASKPNDKAAIQAAEGKFLGDELVGPVMECHPEAARAAAVEADVAAALARSLLTDRGRARGYGHVSSTATGIGLRTRRLREHERGLVAGLVDRFMAQAAAAAQALQVRGGRV